jgi:hypothetical protein
LAKQTTADRNRPSGSADAAIHIAVDTMAAQALAPDRSFIS